MLPSIPTAEDLLLAEEAARAWWPAACEALDAALAARHPDCVLVVQGAAAWIVWAPHPRTHADCARGAFPWRDRTTLDRRALIRIRWGPHALRSTWFLHDLVHAETTAESITWDAWAADWAPLTDAFCRRVLVAVSDALAHCPPARCGWGSADGDGSAASGRDLLLWGAGVLWMLAGGWVAWCWPFAPTLGWPTAPLPGPWPAALPFGLAALGGILLRAARHPGVHPETGGSVFFAYLAAANWGLLVLMCRSAGFLIGPAGFWAYAGWGAATALGCLVGFGRLRRGRLAPTRIPPAHPPSLGG